MSLTCLFGLHRPLPLSIVRREEGLSALCDGCGRPMDRRAGDKWRLADPVVDRAR